jgi:histidine triad (HIT) family protein
MEECLFCKIVRKEIKSTIVYEDDDIMVFKDIQPQAPVHMLIIPKKHIRDIMALEAADEALIGKIAGIAKTLAQRFSISECGFRLVSNCGPDAGQAVDHLHFHLLGGRKFGWPPG